VVWQDSRRGHAYDIYGTRGTPQGTVAGDSLPAQLRGAG
jgi:hypothetical protein